MQKRLGEDSQGVIHTLQVTKDGRKIYKVCKNGRWFVQK